MGRGIYVFSSNALVSSEVECVYMYYTTFFFYSNSLLAFHFIVSSAYVRCHLYFAQPLATLNTSIVIGVYVSSYY